VLVNFYPKGDAPGRTALACALRDGCPEISGRPMVFGVSVDSIKSHEQFIRKHSHPADWL
jgi:thioredoxin-dependent peroxiredoxin